MKNIEYKNMHLNDGSIIEYHYSAPKITNQLFVFYTDLYATTGIGSIKLTIFSMRVGLLIHNYRHHFGSTSSLKLKELNFEMIANDLKLLFDQLEIDSPILSVTQWA